MSEFSLSKIIRLLEKANDRGVNISFLEDELSVHVQKGRQIDKSLLDELKTNKPFLVHYFKNFDNKEYKANVEPIQKVDRSTVKRIPLSYAQERLWFIHQLEGSVQYHLPTVLRLNGRLKVEALDHALQSIINRHEILRTVILEEDGTGFQHIKDIDQWHLDILDGLVYKNEPEGLQNFIRELLIKPFNLSQDYMLRASLINIGTEDHVLVVTMHHIASDAWSTSILVKEVLEFYTAYIEKRSDNLVPLGIQYADYANWQRSHLNGEILNTKLKYWKDKLEGLETLELPKDYVRPQVRSTKGSKIYFTIDTEKSHKLRKLSQKEGTTLFITFLAVFKIMLHRYTGQRDICVGTSFARREQLELEDLIGFFVNTLALRDKINPNDSFIQLLQQVKATTLEAYENQDIPFEKIVETVDNERSIGRNPLFQVLLTMINTPEIPELSLGDTRVSIEKLEHFTSQLDIICDIRESSQGIQGSIEYSTELFTKHSIQRMIEHLKILLSSVLKQPEEKIRALAMLSKQEEYQLLIKFNDTKVESPRYKNIIRLFEDQVAKAPDNISVVFEENILTYRQLNERVNQLAHYLKYKGVKEEQLVPICIERSPEMIVAILGVLKAGAAYIPIDPLYPEERIRYIMGDAKASIVITKTIFETKLQNLNIETVMIDNDWEIIKNQSLENLKIDIACNHLAYVIYTSGSTGKPKGVMIEHASLLSYLVNHKANYINNDSTNNGKTKSGSFIHLSYTFDASLTGIFMPLIWGKRVVIGSKQSVDIFEDSNLHKYAPYDFIKITPSHLQLLESKMKTTDGQLLTKKLIIGGEALFANHLNYLVKEGLDVTIVNEYGPTEATVGCSIFSLNTLKDKESIQNGNNIPIGKPIDNTQLYILGDSNELLPVGVMGELCIGGAGLARGYLNLPKLTTEKFIKNPFSQDTESRLYKTGDIACWLDNGNIKYIGRKDEQVKIRGHRVELGEIESVLQECSAVRHAAVVTREDKHGNNRLIAYIIPCEEFDQEAILYYLKKQLPDYMIPAVLMELDSLPLTVNGKVDRKSLPDPEVISFSSIKYIAPSNDTERVLAEIWQDVLEVDQVGINDDFHALGGHSLLAIRLISAIRKAFSIEMPIGDIFDHPTVALLAAQLAKQSNTTVLPVIEKVEPRPERIPLSFSQERLWFIDQLDGSLQYHVHAVLRLTGNLNKQALAFSLKNTVNRHEVLRTVYREEDGHPYQFLKDADSWQLTFADGKAYINNHENLEKYIQQLISKAYNLSEDYVFRATLINLGDQDHVLVVMLHHIASDGWSRSVLINDFTAFYNAYEDGRPTNLPLLPIQYADYAIWQRRYLSGMVLDKKISYWKEKLQGVPPLLLPTDHQRPAIQSAKGKIVEFSIDKVLSDQLKTLSHKQGATLFMTLLATFEVLLYRYSGQKDICLGIPIAGRQQEEVENLIGFFVNTLAIRINLNGDENFIELLKKVRTVTLEAYKHQEVPFEKVVDAVLNERDLSRNPLVQVMFNLRNTLQVPELRFGDVQLSNEGYRHTTSQFDMVFMLTETHNGIFGYMEYSTDLYFGSTILRMLTHYKQLLSSIINIEEVQQKISLLSMLTPSEEQQLLLEFNKIPVIHSENEKSIINLFEDQAAKTPDAIAVVFNKELLTFSQLNRSSNQLAHYLINKGVKENILVPICIEPSLEMMVGIFGILKAGGAYVPVDPDFPQERINYILNDTGASIVLSNEVNKQKIPVSASIEIIEIHSDFTTIDQYPTHNLKGAIKTDQLAYIIYTSGSTGKPKGVMIEHNSLLNYLLNNKTKYIGEVENISGSYVHLSYTFDASLTAMFMPLLFGKLVVIGSRQSVDVFEDSNLLKYAPYDFIKITPAHLDLLLPRFKAFSNGLLTERLVIGGEALHPAQFKTFIDEGFNVEVINEYGPTEATVGCTTYSFYTLADTDKIKNNISIGQPINNVIIYILDGENHLVPIGVKGEICVGGAGVARGYLNRPQLSGEKFIKDPFSNQSGDRIYKTGDMGRWLPDGNIEYQGRVDDQVKIRGYRIELGEIEHVLQDCEWVTQGAVLVKEDKEGSKRLVSYYVPDITAVKSKERELSYQRVANWKELYEVEYGQTEGNENIDPEFNIIGWSDTFTADVIPAEEMKEWLDDIVKVVLSDNPDNVLEIGCGTGLIYYQLAGKVKKYIGCDLSRSSINQIIQQIGKGLRDYGDTELFAAPAHEVTLQEGQQVDTILLNSMVQYFPGEDYMNTVMKKCISLLNGDGRIIVGDVRDKRLLKLFKGRLQANILKEFVSINEFEWAVEQEVLKENELCIDPGYFFRLQDLFPEINHIEIQWKQASYINELSLYRYTVVIYLGSKKEIIEPEWQSWLDLLGNNIIIDQLNEGREVIAIKDAPNPRLWKEKLFNNVWQHKLVSSIGDLLRTNDEEDEETNQLSVILNAASANGYNYRLLLDEDPLKVNIILERSLSGRLFHQAYYGKGLQSIKHLTNVPLFIDISWQIQKDIRLVMQQKLPDYMVPSEMIPLCRMPLTANGKLDRKFLSQREERSHINAGNYLAPSTELEQLLVTIWQEILGSERIGIEDNFFEMGGDSILTIQIVSRLRRLGYELKPKDIFIYQTIGRLAKAILGNIGAIMPGEQGELKGRSGLLPIQQWYLQNNKVAVSHFNQHVLLGLDKSITAPFLLAATEQLILHHDALRFKYKQTEEGWQQEYGKNTQGFFIEDLRHASQASLYSLITSLADKHQRSLDIEKGELVRVVWIPTPDSEANNRLLLVIHHLAVDGVSWRIILEDLELMLNGMVIGQKTELSHKSNSYRQWYDVLEKYSKSSRLLSQKKYWNNVIKNYEALPVDKDCEGEAKEKDSAHHTIRLGTEQTIQLLQEVPRAYHTEINDILLGALVKTLTNWIGKDGVIIGLEGHGREDIAEGIDTSRTVGWFTSLYPVELNIGVNVGNDDLIKTVKEQLRQVPDKGLGYGVLKYINREASLSGTDPWDIVFNYLGQLDNVVNKVTWLRGAGESGGAGRNELQLLKSKLSVNSSVRAGQLVLNWSYSSRHYEASTVTKLATDYISNLESIIVHCIWQQKSQTVFTPSDYGLGGEITNKELDRFLKEPYKGKPRRENIEGLYRLSGLQQGMLFHGLYDDKIAAYTEQFCCDLVDVDVELLNKSWSYVLMRHTVLRSAFYHGAFNVPVQCVYRDVELSAKILDYRSMNDTEQYLAIKEYEKADLMNGFDFSNPPLMRLELLRVADSRYRMFWTYHHILFDGWSVPILMEDFLTTYESLIIGKEVSPMAKDSFEDYIRYIEGRDADQEQSYWRNYLKGIGHSTLLPFIKNTAARTKGAGEYKSVFLEVNNVTTAKIQSYAQRHRLTVNTILQGVWSYLLHSYTGNNEVSYGVIVSGRPDDMPNVEQRVGMYINTLPLHSRFQQEKKIIEWLQNLQEEQVSSRQYQYTPLQDIQRLAGVQGDLFDTLLVFENYPVSKVIKSTKWSLQVENVRINQTNNYPLSILISSSQEITIRFSYNTTLLEERYIDLIRNHFENVLLQMVANPENRLNDISLLTPTEEHQLLVQFNDAKVSFPKERNIVDLFEEQAEQNPQKVAVIFELEQLTYKELNQLSNRLAHYLRSKGVKQETLVPICIERSLDMIVGIMAILKAGGAYVPIDPEYPIERIKYILEDTKATLIVSNRAGKEKIQAESNLTIVAVDEQWPSIYAEAVSNPQPAAHSHNLVYVIYTSGSTGKPKGVMIEHNALLDHCYGVIKDADLTKCTSFALFSPLVFDAGHSIIFSTFILGASLHVISNRLLMDGVELHQYINDNSIDCIKIVPSLWLTYAESNNLILANKVMIFGGEGFPMSIFERLLKSNYTGVVYNHYGPTEATIGKCIHKVDLDKTYYSIPIGKPFSNTKLYVLNANMCLVPIGVQGELYIAGDGLARGYLNMPEITEEKFIANPFSKDVTSKIYKTGDQVRWLPDGNIEYIGRIDEQIKIRGYRIELNEIEIELQQSGFVRHGVVAAIGENINSNRLVGYVVTDKAFDKEALVAHLRTRLPDYMVPTVWIEMEKFSLTANGKIDKKALPVPDKNDLVHNAYMAPRNELENKLTAIWKELLQVKEVGITDNFFELGGHSLLAMRVISSIRSEFGVELAIKDLFIHPTIMALAGHLSTKEKDLSASDISIQKRPEHIPLSFSQERVWFIDQLEGSLQYHLPTVLKLTGNLNKDALVFALQNIINRHEVLRTVILEEGGNGYQYIKAMDEFDMMIVDGGEFIECNYGEVFQNYIKQLINEPFDLSTDHMLRATLITLEPNENLLVVTMHHIASDKWSQSVMVTEVVELYNSFIENRYYQLPDIQLQYADYAIWQRSNFNEDLLTMKLDYWKEKLQNISFSELPADFQRPPVQSTRGANISFHIDKDLSLALSQLSRQQECTIFMTLLTTLKVLLYRYTNSHDICVGTPIAGRQQKQLEGLIGFFVNTLPLRTQLNDKIIFKELLLQVKATTLEAYEHQEIPFEKVVESVVHERDMSRNPLFQVMLVLQNTPEVAQLNLQDLTLARFPHEVTKSKFDITFYITETDQGLQGTVEYCTDLFASQTIQRMIAHFKELLTSVVKTPLKKISDLIMLSKIDERQLLFEFNNTAVPYPHHETVISLFKKQVGKTPDNVAIVCGEKKLTYKQLHELSNQLAHLLRTKGVKKESLIPICMERGYGLMVGILGILKAGGVYVPIDPDYPADRISYMIEDSVASLVIAGNQSKNKLADTDGIEILELDESLGLLDGQSIEDLETVESHQLAYVIYTSGSTGRPKGAGVFHRGIVNLLQWYVKEFSIEDQDNILIISSHAFDLTQKNLLGPLLVGATVVMPDMNYYDTQIITKCIREKAVTIINCAPHAFYPLVEDGIDLKDLDSLRLVVLGGESINLQRLENWILSDEYDCEIVNSYGPTECTDIASFYRMKNPKDYLNRIIPMGHPNDNVQLFVLDKAEHLLSVGLMGEIYIGGDGVGAGYLRDERLTSLKFIPNPFNKEPGSRLYKTGDLGRWMSDGNIEYLGRMDDQVKIRGYRIELGEIESLLHQHEQIHQAVVLAKEDSGGNKRLVGYLVSEESLNKEEIISYLRERVPSYMIPALWVLMKSFPLTPNGKVDKKALPDKDLNTLSAKEFIAPRNEIEESIAVIWRNLLHIERIGIYDSFFELGGHSLLAMRVVSAIRKEFDMGLEIKDLFQYSTINDLSKYLEIQLSVYTEENNLSEYDLLNI